MLTVLGIETTLVSLWKLQKKILRMTTLTAYRNLTVHPPAPRRNYDFLHWMNWMRCRKEKASLFTFIILFQKHRQIMRLLKGFPQSKCKMQNLWVTIYFWEADQRKPNFWLLLRYGLGSLELAVSSVMQHELPW